MKQEPKTAAPSVADGGSPVISVDQEREEEILVKRATYQQLLEEWSQLKAERAALGQINVPQRPIITKPLPANYVVFLGPEPPSHVELRMAVKGHPEIIMSEQEFTAKDGDGRGDLMTVKGSVNAGLTGRWLDSGYSDVHFEHRCPPDHRYAGRLWAEILAPEQAAWLQLAYGKDRENNQLFAFRLTEEYRVQYIQLRDSNMRRRHQQDREVEAIMSEGQPMPTPELATAR